MYKGEADWTLIGEVKNNPRIKIPVFGNGDLFSAQIVKEKKEKYGVDGVMIGRGAIGYPWIFKEIKAFLKNNEIIPRPTIQERVKVVKSHLEMSIKWKGERLGILEMRRHYTNYFKGYSGIKNYRKKLVCQDSFFEIKKILNEIVNTIE